MTGSFFGRILGALSGSGVTFGGGFPSGKLADLFKTLAKGDRSMPAALVRYIGDGSNPSVLLTLAGNDCQRVWRQRYHSLSRTVGASVFANGDAWTVEQMQRLGEALAALEPINHDWGMVGSKATPDWLRHVVSWWVGRTRHNIPATKRAMAKLVALAEPLGQPAGSAAVLDLVFGRDPNDYHVNNCVERFEGVGEWLAEAHATVSAAAPGLPADARAELALTLGRFGLQQPYLELLLDLATGPSKKVRAAGRQALTNASPAMLEAALDARFAKAAPGARAELVDVAANALAEQATAILARWREGESAAKVIATLDRVGGAYAAPLAATAKSQAAPAADATAPDEPADGRRDGPEGYAAVDGEWVTVPPMPSLPAMSPVPPELLKTLHAAMASYNARLAEERARNQDVKWHWSRNESPKDQSSLAVLDRLAGNDTRIHGSHHSDLNWLKSHWFKHPAIDQFFHDPRLTLRHLTRLAVALGGGRPNGLMNGWAGPVGAALIQRLADGEDFRVFYHLWLEANGEDFLDKHLTQRWYGSLLELPAEIWPLLCERFAAIDEGVGMAPQSGTDERKLLPTLDLLALFKKLPDRYRSKLMLLGGDSSSHVRNRARALLQGTPGIDGAIALQLQDGRQDVRALTAEWLGARRAVDQAHALRTAADREKSDLAKAAMITALQRLGQDVAQWFDRDQLLKEAKAGLAKARPKSVDWFPMTMLPPLKWADGSAVDPQVPQWWLIVSAKLKQPGGNQLMTLWLEQLAPGDAHRLGWTVLTAWIDQDIRRPSDEEANAYALQYVDATLQQNLGYVKQWGASADYWPTDRSVIFAQLKQRKAGEYLGSASDSKGILALAARVNGADAVQKIRPFLKDHGARVAQAKALLDLLAAIGSSSALQLLLSAANRSKQRSVQAHGAALIDGIAERNGWTAAQLADRTVPTGGFDIDGTQDLDLGENRTYRLMLDPQDVVVLLNADGKEVKSLPAARIDEEKPLVDAAKKQLSNARKEVKQVLTSQAERLQEAMFLQRECEVSEWLNFVAGHPIVGRLASRLVWQAIDADGLPAVTFRPLGDGSYSDAADGDVSPDAFASIRLVHSSLLAAGDVAAWRTHLSDYEVQAPFDQLGRTLPSLAPGQDQQSSIEDRQGWMIESFKLRGMATKFGYQRGPAQDGGWFMTYEKRYGEAGLMAEIEFTGSPLPEENRGVALMSLSFRKLRGAHGGTQVKLGDVPPVLLAESWHDLHEMAGKGTGFDPDWKKKAF